MRRRRGKGNERIILKKDKKEKREC